MPKMVCAKCQLPLVPKKGGVYVAEMFSSPPRVYKLWMADLWTCRACGVDIVAGFGDSPIKEHWEDGFEKWFESFSQQRGVVIIKSYEHAEDVPSLLD